MPEELTFTADDLVASALGTNPGTTQEDEPEEAAVTAEQEPEEEPSEPAGSGRDDPDPALEHDDGPSKYDKVTDPAELRGIILAKDRGYMKMEPYAKLGQLFDKVQTDPDQAKALVMDLVKTHGIELGDKQAAAEQPEAWEPPDDWDDDAKSFFNDLVVPYTAQATKALTAEVAALKAQLSEVLKRVEEPLSAYEESKKSAGFEAAVSEAAPEALRLFQLREKREATKDDLKAAMGKYQESLKSGELRPVDALQLHMRNRKGEKEQRKADLPEAPAKTTGGKRAVDPHTDPEQVAAEVVGALWPAYNKRP